MKRVLLIAILLKLVALNNTNAQYYSSGADPANTKWHQVNSDVFKVVYPQEFEAEAKRFIAMLDSLYQYGGHTLKHTPKPINVLIHSKSAYSNGFVSWAPKRIEIYPTPHQDMFGQDWLEQLAIHEFRHVVQIDKLNKGFTKLLSVVFGQQAVGAVLGLYAPLWFLEGDATLTETTLSNTGRGRKPAFEQEIRAQLIEKERYHYDKAYFGSYKDYIPNHYHMGYLLTAGARHKYGADIWERALDESARKSWSITPFNRGIKQVSGKNKVPLYNEVFNDWLTQWQSRFDSTNFTQLQTITERDCRYKNYQYPTFINDEYILTEINGSGELNRFAKINIKTGHEEKLVITGNRNREPFAYSNNKIAWTELERHPRWDNQYFSIVRIYDIETGKQKKLTKQSRYKAPCLSPTADTIAIINTSYNNTFSIHLISSTSGKLIEEISIPDNAYPMTPSWSSNELLMILLTKQGKKISSYNLKTNQWIDILPPSYTEIRFPKRFDEHIYFSGSWSGIEELYRVQLDGSGLEKLNNAKFGTTYPSVYKEMLLYQDYTSDGYLAALSNIQQLEATPFQPQDLPIEPFINKLQKDEKGLPDLKNVSTDKYVSKKYSKWNIFNFHSWAPAFVNFDNTEINLGASALSQNLLGTTFTTIGFNADQQYSREKYYLKFSHRAWWPILNFEIKAGDEKHKVNGYYSNETDTFHIELDAKPKHLAFDFDMKLPLNLTRGKYSRLIQPSIGLSYQQSEDYIYKETNVSIEDNEVIANSSEIHTIEGLDIKSLDYDLLLYNLHRTTQRDVGTRFGQVVEFIYRHTPFSGNDYGDIFAIHSRLYFPGIERHHSIRIDNDWQTKNRGDEMESSEGNSSYRVFSDIVRFPRGMAQYMNDEAYSLKADYMMPVCNPDFNIRGIMYLKRINMNLFYDYTKANYTSQASNSDAITNSKNNYQSFGTELRAELHPFRFVFPISLGYRYAYIPTLKNHHHEILFSMGLSSIVVGK